ncbi:cytochrome P450 [Streptomyces sp. PSAA01]|uniref:cytochrome P450 n=1 Tax=Streptomyces sp. PSAA01 TaxID=2912762 RepID=UPI001F2B84FD|nr:cytochrome P450 [Streptomyces sp. PSAA01]MCG0286179.1 cytochrome P450 [Streptomyces sp. PSAA01]
MAEPSQGLPSAALPDLSAPSLYRSGRHYEAWAELRARGPVHLIEPAEGEPFFSVVRYHAASEVLGNPQLFSSTRGMRLGADDVATAAATGKMLVITDPPRHGKIRRIVSSAFTPKMIRRLEHNMREIAVSVINAALEGPECDFADIAARLPVSMICDMLGVPRQDWDFMLDRTKVAFGIGNDAVDDETRANAAHIDLFLYYQDLMRLRRKEPADDIVTALVNGHIDGVALTDEEVVLNCNGLVSGGNETTRHATIGGMRALIENRDQWRRLRAGEAPLDGAVQEILRFTTPAMHVMRTATRATDLAGTKIPEGARIAVWLGSGNRDDEKFADPSRFDLGRTPNRHLTFAYGPHFCIGAALATLELQVMFTELIGRIGDAELVGEPVRMYSNLIGGYESMPVALTRRVG